MKRRKNCKQPESHLSFFLFSFLSLLGSIAAESAAGSLVAVNASIYTRNPAAPGTARTSTTVDYIGKKNEAERKNSEFLFVCVAGSHGAGYFKVKAMRPSQVCCL
jgi:hypothetical protein